MTIVRMRKLSGKRDATLETGISLTGQEGDPPTIGKPYALYPPIRFDDGERWDFFHTTKVLAINDDILTTKNSRWQREVIKT